MPDNPKTAEEWYNDQLLVEEMRHKDFLESEPTVKEAIEDTLRTNATQIETVKLILAQGADVERKAVLARLVEAGKLDSVELRPHFKYRGTVSNNWKDADVCRKCEWVAERCVCLHNGMIGTVTNA